MTGWTADMASGGGSSHEVSLMFGEFFDHDNTGLAFKPA